MLIAGFIPVSAGAQATAPETRTVRVTGEATVSAAPDQAEIEISVLTEARGANQAVSENARITTKVLSDLKKVLEPGAEIKTAGFSLDPKYEFTKPGEQKLTGYAGKNTVSVKTGKLDLIGKVVDTAVAAGANGIGSIRFTLKDEQSVRLEALRRATQNAMDKAKETAGALGLRIAGVINVEEEGTRVQRPVFRREMSFAAAAPGTPVEVGDIEVHDSVTLTAEIAPKD